MSPETRSIPADSIRWELRDDQTEEVVAKGIGGSMPPALGTVLSGIVGCPNWQVTQFGGINIDFDQEPFDIYYVILGRCIQFDT